MDISSQSSLGAWTGRNQAKGVVRRFLLPAMCFMAGICGSSMILSAAPIVQDTDPLGNPIQKAKPASKSDPAKSSGNSTSGTEVVPKPTDKPNVVSPPTANGSQSDLSLPKSKMRDAGDLRNYNPVAPAQDRLPTKRDFLGEGQTAREMVTQGQTTQEEVPQQLDPNDPAIQTQSADGDLKPASHGHFQLVKRSTERWTFGLKVVAGGNTTGVVASAPVPIPWEEQTIRVVREYKTPNVGRVTMKKFAGQGQQMIVSIPRMGPGEEAQATITLEIDRMDIVQPTDTDSLQLPPRGFRPARPYLGESPYIETGHKRIVELADSIVDPQAKPWDQVQSIYDWVQQNIQYQFDPQIHSCLEALDNKRGDCEEVASLFIALCRTKGIPARAVWCNDHTYPEFMLCTADGKAVWFPCQITTTEHMFGVMYDDRPILQKGDKFAILGEHAPNRYLKPAMTARQAAGAPAFQWIIQKTEGNHDVAPANSPLGN